MLERKAVCEKIMNDDTDHHHNFDDLTVDSFPQEHVILLTQSEKPIHHFVICLTLSTCQYYITDSFPPTLRISLI